MIAVHLNPGPNGFAVLTSDGSVVLADGMEKWRALRMVRGGDEAPQYKFKGRRGRWAANTGRVEQGGFYITSAQVHREGRRHRQEWYAHLEAQR